jgi:hypothetical protein
MAAFDEVYLDGQFPNGSDSTMYEFEVFRVHDATVTGNPEGPKAPNGQTYVNLDIANYGDDEEAYRWLFLIVNNRTRADYSRVIPFAKAFSLTGAALEASSQEVMDVDQWLRAFAYESLLGCGDAYFTGANHHNLRVYVRPGDGRILALPWDWDSAFQNATSSALIGGANLAKIVNLAHNRRLYYHHLYDLITTTYNTTYMGPWIQHYSALAGENFSARLTYIGQRATFVLSQLPRTNAFAITNNAGNDFATNSETILLTGTAPIQVKTLEVNATVYAPVWTSLTAWRIKVPLRPGANLLTVRGLDDNGHPYTNALDTITVTNTAPTTPPLLPVVINEWMADNAGPGGFPDPLDGRFQDWFELFNPNTNAVDLSGFHLTDDLAAPTQWPIPVHTIIPGRGFLLVWADAEVFQNGLNADLHADFRLDADGDVIGLFAADGVTPQHIIFFGRQTENVSEGLFPDGDTRSLPYPMTQFTPRAANRVERAVLPRITHLAVQADGRISFTIATTVGRIYRIEFKDDLDDPIWLPLREDFPGTGSEVLISDVIGTRPQRFYRVVVE